METFLSVGLANALVLLILAPIAFFIGKVARRPALTHALWVIVLLKLITPSWIDVPIIIASNKERVVEKPIAAPQAPIVTNVPLEERPVSFEFIDRTEVTPATLSRKVAKASKSWSLPVVSWQKVVGGIWIAGSAAWLLLAAWRITTFWRSLKLAEPAEDLVRAQVDEMSQRIGLARSPLVLLSPGKVSPMVLSLGKPRLVVPRELWKRLNQEQRGTLLIHELAHLKRRDHWVRLIELAATGLYWWHPALWWGRRELHKAEEQCCDLWVVHALPKSGKTYAMVLVEAVEFLSGASAALPAGASGMGQVEDLSRRIGMIMRGNTPRGMSRLGLMGMIGLAALLLPLRPSLARQEAPPKIDDKPATSTPSDDPKLPPAIARESTQDPKVVMPPKEGAHPPKAAEQVLEILKEKLQIAEQELARIEQLHKHGAVSEAQRSRAQVNVAAAKLEFLRQQAATEQEPNNQTDALLSTFKTNLTLAQDRLKWAESMEKKGYISHSQLVADRAALEKAKLAFQNALTGPSAEKQHLRDQLEIFASQLDTKRAAILKAQAQVRLAGTELSRLDRLEKKGAGFVSQSEKEKAQAEVAVAEANLVVAQADAAEVETRVQQVKRKLETPKDQSKSDSEPKASDGPASATQGGSPPSFAAIGLALHEYHDAKGHFPSANGNPENPNGPPVSWRVAILPYLKDPRAKDLYKWYHFDESWDSPNNSSLMSWMPAVYHLMGSDMPQKSGQTYAKAVVGAGTGWGQGNETTTIDDFDDRPRNTLMVVEASEPIPWMKPEDFTIATDGKPIAVSVANFGSPKKGGFHALFADGSVRFLKLPISAPVFRALSTRAGGEILEEKAYGRGSDADDLALVNEWTIGSLESAIADEFKALPDVIRLTNEIEKIHNKITSIQRVAHRDGDPALKVQMKKRDDLTRQHDELWSKLYPTIRRKLLASGPDGKTDTHATEPRDIATRLSELEAKVDRLLEAPKQQEADAKNSNAKMMERLDLLIREMETLRKEKEPKADPKEPDKQANPNVIGINY